MAFIPELSGPIFFLVETMWEYLPYCCQSLIHEKVKQLLLALLDFGQVVTFLKWHSRCLCICLVYPRNTKAHSSCRTLECDRDVHADRGGMEGVERGGTEWSRTAGGMSEGLFWSPIILHFVLDLLESSCLNKYTLLWLSRFPRHPPALLPVSPFGSSTLIPLSQDPIEGLSEALFSYFHFWASFVCFSK